MTPPTRTITFTEAYEQFADTGRVLHVTFIATMDSEADLVVQVPGSGDVVLNQGEVGRAVRLELPPIPTPDWPGAVIDATVKVVDGAEDTARMYLQRTTESAPWLPLNQSGVSYYDHEIVEIHDVRFVGIRPVSEVRE